MHCASIHELQNYKIKQELRKYYYENYVLGVIFHFNEILALQNFGTIWYVHPGKILSYDKYEENTHVYNTQCHIILWCIIQLVSLLF